MILTNCAACAAPLAHTAPRCVRCHTRYCNQTCQHDHWRRGHKQMCKKIHRGGNAEQYHADKKYKEAVAVAVKACADDTKGQTCYICTQALHWKTKEGLVRMCACRGTAGFAHVSCLAEQAKILVAEAEENNWDDNRFMPRWKQWYTCNLCEQKHHGDVYCALGWACWKTYLGRPEMDWTQQTAMMRLGNGLYEANHYEEARPVQEAQLSNFRRYGASEEELFDLQNNLANTYKELGRLDQALSMRQDVYNVHVKLFGEQHVNSLVPACNYAMSLASVKRYAEAKSLLRRTMLVARRVVGDSNATTLALRRIYARALCEDPAATLEDLREAVTTLEDAAPTARRVLGSVHPGTTGIEEVLGFARATLRRRETRL